MARTAVRQRALAFGLGLVVTGGAVWGAALVLLLGGIASQPPDASAPDFGDPCCPVPDDSAQVAGWSAVALAAAAVDACVLALGWALLHFALRGRWPTRRVGLAPLLLIPAVGSVIAVGQIAGA